MDSLIHNGVLEISLKDAISLALENNLDIAIARYNIPIAEADMLRTKAGGVFRGVNTGVVQNTPGGGVGGLRLGRKLRRGAGGTTGGAGGSGSGAGGLVQSTLGTGTAVLRYDPAITGKHERTSITVQPLSNVQLQGVQSLKHDYNAGGLRLYAGVPDGHIVERVVHQRPHGEQQSSTRFLRPELDASYTLAVPAAASRGLRVRPEPALSADREEQPEDLRRGVPAAGHHDGDAVANMYWDLVAAYEDEQVKSRSLDFANADAGRAGASSLSCRRFPRWM
jgi:hypothetical protein